jgi:cytochrome c-type biogenesis protein CcmH
MTLWIVFAALTLAVLALLLVPLLRRQTAAPARIDYDVAVYRDQLTEVERDAERGLLNPAQLAAARTEIQRRMLTAADADAVADAVPDAITGTLGRWLRLVAAMVILVGVPGGALVFYAAVGAPGLPGQPYAERQNSQEFKMLATIEKLATELQRRPDPKGFAALGGAYRMLHRYEDAAAAYRQAVQLGASDVETLSALGETVVMANRGGVMPEARQVFLQVLQANPKDPRARYYLGLSKAQIGKAAEALAIWRDLEQDSPADAPWLPMLKEHIAETAKQAKLDPASVAPQAPSTEGVAAAAPATDAAQPAEGQDAMIRSMVAGLAAKMEKNPADFDGWLRLARAYRVQGQLDKARDAANHAIALKPQDADAKLALADVQLAAAPNDQLPADFIATIREVLALDPTNGDALFYMGAAEAQAGHPAQAREAWTKLLAQMPADATERADIVKQIESLPKN